MRFVAATGNVGRQGELKREMLGLVRLKKALVGSWRVMGLRVEGRWAAHQNALRPDGGGGGDAVRGRGRGHGHGHGHGSGNGHSANLATEDGERDGELVGANEVVSGLLVGRLLMDNQSAVAVRENYIDQQRKRTQEWQAAQQEQNKETDGCCGK